MGATDNLLNMIILLWHVYLVKHNKWLIWIVVKLKKAWKKELDKLVRGDELKIEKNTESDILLKIGVHFQNALTLVRTKWREYFST